MTYADIVLRRALAQHGNEAQTLQLVEEVGELLTGINHLRRGRITPSQLADEIADVRIMLAQLAMMHDIEGEVEAALTEKIARLAKRLEHL